MLFFFFLFGAAPAGGGRFRWGTVGHPFCDKRQQVTISDGCYGICAVRWGGSKPASLPLWVVVGCTCSHLLSCSSSHTTPSLTVLTWSVLSLLFFVDDWRVFLVVSSVYGRGLCRGIVPQACGRGGRFLWHHLRHARRDQRWPAQSSKARWPEEDLQSCE